MGILVIVSSKRGVLGGNARKILPRLVRCEPTNIDDFVVLVQITDGHGHVVICRHDLTILEFDSEFSSAYSPLESRHQTSVSVGRNISQRV